MIAIIIAFLSVSEVLKHKSYVHKTHKSQKAFLLQVHLLVQKLFVGYLILNEGGHVDTEDMKTY